MKTIEEIYSARYKKETSQSEERLKKSEDRTTHSFPEFVAEYFNDKFKNRRMVEQNALDLCQSVEIYDTEYPEIRIFSQFLSQTNSTEILIFFLYARNTAQNILSLQLTPSNVYSEFPGQKIADTRAIVLTYKQSLRVAGAVFAEEDSLQRGFISELERNFKDSTIKFYDLLLLFVENYKASSQGNHNHSLSPFSSDRQTDTFVDSLLNTGSDMLKSVNLSQTPVLSQVRSQKEPVAENRPLPRGPFDKIKELCIDHCNNTLVHQFVVIILSGYLDEDSDSREEIINYVEEVVADKMTVLIEALCRCDKRKWMEALETDDKECLRHCENLQKKMREIQKKSNQPSIDDVDQICKEILQTQQLKMFISEKIRDICQE